MNSKLTASGIILGTVLHLATGCSSPGPVINDTIEKPKLDVRWGGTPSRLMEEMFRFAKIEKSDVIYDLGCGDGRIVITAAQKYGIKGVGIDLDPIRIQESMQNLQKSGIPESQVKFLCQNLFEVDLSEATVLAIYLNKKVNRKLREKIFREMKPGTRIVSHNWDMGNWKPDGITHIENRTVFYWLLPANASGQWAWTLPGDKTLRNYEMTIEQTYQKGKGFLNFYSLQATIPDISISGNEIQINYDETIGNDKFNFRYSGILSEDTIKGKVIIKKGTIQIEEIWNAKRKAGSTTKIIEPVID